MPQCEMLQQCVHCSMPQCVLQHLCTEHATMCTGTVCTWHIASNRAILPQCVLIMRTSVYCHNVYWACHRWLYCHNVYMPQCVGEHATMVYWHSVYCVMPQCVPPQCATDHATMMYCHNVYWACHNVYCHNVYCHNACWAMPQCVWF